MTLRSRLIAFGAVCFLAVAALAAYLIAAHNKQEDRRANAPTVAQTTSPSLANQPRIVFRNTSIRQNYGDIGMVALSDPGGPRVLTDTSCDRVYATTVDFLCLASERGIATTYTAKVMNLDLKATQNLPLTGIPSRARLSRDGKLAATTSFVAGDSYTSTNFSTRTIISAVGGGTVGDLEIFKLLHNGSAIQPIDRNYWGVTFAADDNTFYATVKWSKTTWLVRGNLAAKTVQTIVSDAECPSLSPDGEYIVYKQRSNLPTGKWRLVRYTIATGQIVPLAEKNSVDDQVEWLDDNHVMYGLPRSGTGIDDVWVVPADGTGSSKILIQQAWSPAVVN